MFMAMTIHVTVLWVMTSYNDVVGYQYFGQQCYLHLQGEVCHLEDGPLECWYPITSLQCHNPEDCNMDFR